MAMKLHSGRLTDARDVVALAAGADFDRVADHLHRGDREQLQAVLERMLDTIKSEDFADAFKGVFTEQELPGDQIEQVQVFLQERITELAAGEDP